jgi:twitching motility protein PilT
MAKIDAFFQLMHEQGASDLHLVSGQQPALRIRGDMERIKYNVLDNDELKAMLYEIAPEHRVKQYEETGDVDFAYEIPNLARYRANFFQQKYGVAAVFREIPSKILTVQELGASCWLPARPDVENRRHLPPLSMKQIASEKIISLRSKTQSNLFTKARAVL